MGLNINTYGYSYGVLHEIRAWALKVETNPRKLNCDVVFGSERCGECVYCQFCLVNCDINEWQKITKYWALINHCDCEGYYINLNKHGLAIKDFSLFYKSMMGDLEKLQEEVRELNEFSSSLSPWLVKPWQDFSSDVLEEEYLLKFQ